EGPPQVPGLCAGAEPPSRERIQAAVATGIAPGAITALVAMQLFAPADLRDSPVVQHELGRLGAGLRAARALMEVQAESQWHRAIAGTLDDKSDFAQSLQGNAWIHAACADVVSGCYTLGGSAAMLTPSPLPRRLRRIHAARQHAFAQERFYARAGANTLGFPPVDPI